jgi:hypothetical protein
MSRRISQLFPKNSDLRSRNGLKPAWIRETREAAAGWKEWQGARLDSILFKEHVTIQDRPRPQNASFRLLDLDLAVIVSLL